MRLFASFVAIGLILTACSTQPAKIIEPAMQEPTLFESISLDIQEGRLLQAESRLSQFDLNKLNKQEYLEYLLLSAQLHLANQEADLSALFIDEAEERLTAATAQQQTQFYRLKLTYLEATGQFYTAALARYQHATHFKGEAAQANQQGLWANLLKANEKELVLGAIEYQDTTFGGWLQLASIVRNSHLVFDEQISQIEAWRQQHPRHPASLNLPLGLEQMLNAAEQRPEHIALLLPLSGSLEKTGKAIRDGFMAAYYDALNKGFFAPSVLFYDSNQHNDLAAIYAQAQFDGAQWIVGPVDKEKVQQLHDMPTLPLPTLALNYTERHGQNDESIETQISNSDLFQFGLAAEDEAIQIAEQAWADGKRNALVLIPQGQWGERIYTAFEQRWLELGGHINEKHAYPKRQDYNPDVKALLNIDESQRRYNTLRLFFRDKVEFEPRRREDADWIFMVSLAQQARQIKPTLAFNFAADLPVYATSHIYTGEPNPTQDRDLNGIFYCDVPWLLKDNQLYQQVEQALPSGQGSYARLYAMGVDAFRLLPQLTLLSAIPEHHVFGSTGALRLDNEQRIVRRSECTVFRNGRPQKIGMN